MIDPGIWRKMRGGVSIKIPGSVAPWVVADEYIMRQIMIRFQKVITDTNDTHDMLDCLFRRFIMLTGMHYFYTLLTLLNL